MNYPKWVDAVDVVSAIGSIIVGVYVLIRVFRK